MSNLPSNSFNNASSTQQFNSIIGQPAASYTENNQSLTNNENCPGLKQDANSNSQQHNMPSIPYNNMNNFYQNTSQVPPISQPSPVKLPITSTHNIPNSHPSIPQQIPSQQYPYNQVNYTQAQQYGQINANISPLIPSSQPFSSAPHSITNGPPLSAPHPTSISTNSSQYPNAPTFYPVSSGTYSGPPSSIIPPTSIPSYAPGISAPSFTPQGSIPSYAPQVNAPRVSAPSNSPHVSASNYAPQVSATSYASQVSTPSYPPQISTSNYASVPSYGPQTTTPMLRHPTGSPHYQPSTSVSYGPSPSQNSPAFGQMTKGSLPPSNNPLSPSLPILRPPNGPGQRPVIGPPIQNPPSASFPPPPTGSTVANPALACLPMLSGPPLVPPTNSSVNSMSLQKGVNGSPNVVSSQPTGSPRGPPAGYVNSQHPAPPISGLSIPPMAGPPHLNSPPNPTPNFPQGPGKGQANVQNRYPPVQQTNHQTPSNTPFDMARQYPKQPNTQGITQQMGQMSVTKQGFDQLWGHQMVDLMQCRHILPEYPENPPEIKLGQQFADSANVSPDIFRCTLNRIPESNSLLQKSRLPLGILMHPFKDLNHLPVIQCQTIVRCRACRTYINPFVYFADSKRWKCNLCYRINDLPEEFQFDPVTKSYGDPCRRPEIKSATIEFIAPGEYMLRPPQPAVYLFLLDVSQIARESGYIQVFCDTLQANLDQLPGDARTQVGFICYDTHIHFYLMNEGLNQPKEMTVLDIDDVFLPSPTCLLVNLRERRELINDLLTMLPRRHSSPGSPASALGAALQAAHKLMSPTGGRITVFQTCLPNIGPGALTPREDPNARSSKEVSNLTPATDFYKRLSLDCSGAQIAVDLFLLNSQYSDLATLSGVSKFSAGSIYHIPLFKSTRTWQSEQFKRMLTRYLIRKIGFEAVMRVRCTRGITIHTFHGNFFVRSTDLLSLPNVSPDTGFGMQLSIEESLSDLQQVCFQAALLYTSSKGERRIRVHTMALPLASNLTEVLHAADEQCIIGLLSKMAVDRCVSASMSEAREALINVAVDALSAHRLSQNLPAGALSPALHAPMSLKLLPLYLLALLKRKAFRTGTSTRLDDRVADMCDMKTMPLSYMMRAVYPDLYLLQTLGQYMVRRREDDDEEDLTPDPPRLQLTAERINSNGCYLLDDNETMIIFVGHATCPAFLKDTFGVDSFNQVPDEARSLPQIETEGNMLLHLFVDKLNDDRAYASNILILRDNSPSRTIFTEKLVDDRLESSFSYYEFLQHVKAQVK